MKNSSSFCWNRIDFKKCLLSRLRHKKHPQTAFCIAEHGPINLYYKSMVNDDLIPVKDSKYGSNLEQIQILSICAGKYCSVNSLHFNYDLCLQKCLHILLRLVHTMCHKKNLRMNILVFCCCAISEYYNA